MIVWAGGQFEKQLETRINRAIERCAIEYKQLVKLAISRPGRRDFGKDQKSAVGFTPKLSRGIETRLRGRMQGMSGNQSKNALSRFQLRLSRVKNAKTGKRNMLGISIASLPGEPPRRQTGDLWRRISHEIDRSRHVARVGTNLKYALWLEFGTRGGKVITAKGKKVLANPLTGQVFGKRVVQGAIKPRPFFRPTLDKFRGRAEAIIRGAAQ